MNVEEPTLILRRQTEQVLSFYDSLSEGGTICYVVGAGGSGKTTFLASLKTFLEEKDEHCDCLWYPVRQMDDAAAFFSRFTDDLENALHPNKARIKNFFGSSTGKAMVMAVDAAGDLATGGVSGRFNLPQVVGNFVSNEASQLYTQIEDRLVNQLTSYNNKFPANKLVLLIDDIDSNPMQKVFTAVLHDLESTVPRNIMIIASMNSAEIIESRSIIFLDNTLSEEEVALFVTENFGIADEGTISEIFEKSGGYPAALGWMWQNYKAGEDIPSLINRLPSEGFIEKLQKNIFDGLAPEEKEILKACCVLDNFDSFLVSNITGYDMELVTRAMEDFKKRDFVASVTMSPLADGRMIPIFVMNPMYTKAARILYGTQFQTYKKAINSYANALLSSSYALPPVITTRMLGLYKSFSNDPTFIRIESLFSLLELPLEKKRFIWFVVANYFLASHNSEASMACVRALDPIITDISTTSLGIAWKQMSDSIPVLLREDLPTTEELRKIVERIAPLLNEIPEGLEKIIVSNWVGQLKSIISMKFDNPEELIQNLIDGVSPAYAAFNLPTDKEIRDIMILTLEGVKYLTAGNFPLSIAIYSSLLEKSEALTSGKRKELLKLISAKLPLAISERDYYLEIKYSLGIAKAQYVFQKHETSSEITSKDIEHLQEAVELMEAARSHPSYAMTYEWARDYAQEIIDKHK